MHNCHTMVTAQHRYLSSWFHVYVTQVNLALEAVLKLEDSVLFTA